jgi:acyl-CoA thioesterase I
MRYFGLYGALLVLLQALVACGPGSQSTNDQPVPTKSAEVRDEMADAKLVVAFGDSLYAGYRLGPKEGFAPQLQAALAQAGVVAKVHNAGVSGDTTAAGKTRLAFVLDNLARKPDLLVLGLGGNDMLRGIKPAETRANLTAMMDDLKKRGIPVILTGMLASPNMGADYGAAFNPIFPALAKQYQAPLYPFFLDGVVTDTTLMLDDGIHPNAKGVAHIVEGITPLVEGALKASTN